LSNLAGVQRRMDEHPLRERARPDFEGGEKRCRLVDLFAGCGGLTLGVAQAARTLGIGLDVVLASDVNATALDVYRTNFPKAHAVTGKVEAFFNGKLGKPVTVTEEGTQEQLKNVDVIVGGPPCQGHSDLNNWTRRDDPKNALYLRMGRAVEVLEPKLLLIENVPSVRHAKGDVVTVTENRLRDLGYEVAHETLPLLALGVAQARRRHILVATRVDKLSPKAVLEELRGRPADSDVHLRWAIGDLAGLTDPEGYDKPPKANATNVERMQHLLDNDLYDLPNSKRPPCHQNAHSYKSMYGRLRWDKPAQTITSGFGSIGQGRYMHPDEPRALTPHEAARIQGFPDYFDFGLVPNRCELADMIGNAVPPALGRELLSAALPHMFS
jgi:DNA (cytosine-5)-methyltransferase 1